MKSFTKKSLSLLALSMTGALAFGSFVGCSGDDDDTNGGTDAGTTDASKTDATSPITDAGKSDTGTGDAAGDAAPIDAGPQYIRTGAVSFGQNFSNLTYQTTASASFTDYTTTQEAFLPTTTVLDTNCTVTSYATPAPVDAGDAAVVDAGPFVAPEAAGIMITNATTAFPAAVTLTNGSNGLYTSASQYTSTTKYFAGGNSIAFTAAGDPASVGAFTTTVTAPADLGSLSPAPGVTGAFAAIPRGTPLTVTWQDGTINTSVVVAFTATTASPYAYKTLTCTFPAGPGSATIPAADLQAIPQVDGTTVTGRATITPTSSVTTWAAVDGSDAGQTPDASNQDYLVTTSVSGTQTAGTYTNSN
jgi:hypothetical protein